MNQSELVAVPRKLLKAREKSCIQGPIVYGFASHRLTRGFYANSGNHVIQYFRIFCVFVSFPMRFDLIRIRRSHDLTLV